MGETKTCEGDYNDALTIYNSDIIAESYQCSTNSDTMSDIDSATDYGDTNEKKAKQQHRQCFVPRFISYIDSIYMKYSTSVILENKGNTARDHLGTIYFFLKKKKKKKKIESFILI
jgi:hypothetical protein